MELEANLKLSLLSELYKNLLTQKQQNTKRDNKIQKSTNLFCIVANEKQKNANKIH